VFAAWIGTERKVAPPCERFRALVQGLPATARLPLPSYGTQIQVRGKSMGKRAVAGTWEEGA
jgi:hypothetical protein